MSKQLEILDELNDIQSNFEVFHRDNPYIFKLFEELALKAISKGKRKIGSKQIIEVIRWKIWVETEGEKYKINNNYTSRYGRLFVAKHPQYKDRFEFRKLKK